ncbi:hypothetical protein TIFTF001_021776 [Ficus carica]|uniref:Uncharacterized protein n=1 Tax=Ficus carica TaxID=3494 RepID=A0AA88AIL9_FICCA|nr:hypothetical protein TIFTF001_021776 [Ficus carica]
MLSNLPPITTKKPSLVSFSPHVGDVPPSFPVHCRRSSSILLYILSLPFPPHWFTSTPMVMPPSGPPSRYTCRCCFAISLLCVMSMKIEQGTWCTTTECGYHDGFLTVVESRSAEWVRAECGERERESRVCSLVDPSENGGGRVSGGGGRQRMEPREKFER